MSTCAKVRIRMQALEPSYGTAALCFESLSDCGDILRLREDAIATRNGIIQCIMKQYH